MQADSPLRHSELDRKSVVQGKSVDLGGRRIIKKKKQEKKDFKGQHEQQKKEGAEGIAHMID